MTTQAAFKKGDLVTYIADWDRAGTVYYRQAVVFSCGKKQMVLTDAESGKEMGRHFKPAIGALETTYNGNCATLPGGTFPRMDKDQAEAACLAVAAEILAYENARFARCLAGGHGEGYDAAIRKDIAKLHEPRAIDRTGAA